MSASPSQFQQVKSGPLFGKQIAQVDDDQSTAVPSDILDGTSTSDLSFLDTGNLEELSSCGVLSSAELRAARLQNIARTTGKGASAKAKAKTKSEAAVTTGSVLEQTAAQVRAARLAQSGKGASKGQQPAVAVAAQPAQPKPSNAGLTQATAGYPGLVERRSQEHDEDDQSTTASSISPQIIAKPVASQVSQAKPAAAPKAKAVSKQQADAGSTLKCHLDKSSREAIRDMGLFEYMPARNPVVTRHTAKGADWNVGFEEYEHSLGGKADAKPLERTHKADEAMRSLDKQSLEAIKDLGLWQHMPAKNPVVTHQTAKGAAWHVGFEDYQHSLGGVPEAQPLERPQKADELNRHFDNESRQALKQMGLWEHMPAKNPVVTKTSAKGAEWHVGFGQYVHTLGGVPDSQPVVRPHHADVMHRHLDKASRDSMKSAGVSMAFR
jgi:hypothetical protein